MNRRRLLVSGVAGLSVLTGCAGLSGDSPSRTWYVLEDTGGQRRAQSEAVRSLRVTGLPGSDFYQASALAFSRERATRAYFQYASWSESPAERIARLFTERLRSAGGPFPSGARTLRLVLEDLYLDVSGDAPFVRLVLEARLEPGLPGDPGAARAFRIDEQARSADATGMAQASGRALGQAFDEILIWLAETMPGAGLSR